MQHNEYTVQAALLSSSLGGWVRGAYLILLQIQLRMGSCAGTLEQSIGAELQRKSHLCIPFLGIARPQFQFPHSLGLWAIYIFPGSVHIFNCSKIDNRFWKYINLSQILYMSVGIGRHNSKWEPNSYIGFSPALYLQCGNRVGIGLPYRPAMLHRLPGRYGNSVPSPRSLQPTPALRCSDFEFFSHFSRC